MMKDLRIRFGAVLAMALLPLFVITTFRAISAYKVNQHEEQVLLAAAANAATTEIVGTVDTIKDILRTLDPKDLKGDVCKDELSKLADEFKEIDNMIYLDPQGNFMCSAYYAEAAAQSDFPIQSVSDSSPFSTYVGPVEIGDTSRNAMKVMFLRETDEGAQAIFVAGSFLDRVSMVAHDSVLPKGTDIAVLTSGGEVLIDDNASFKPFQPSWIKAAHTESGKLTLASPRVIAGSKFWVMPSSEAELFIGMRTKASDVISWQFLNPVTSGLMPILAWLFAFAAIWLSADRLMLFHMRKLQRSALRFANGDKTERVGDMGDAPEQIAKLGQAFDVMAERVSQREDALTQALVDKERLLREIHHRVKNNLQIIISLLNIQERRLKDPSGKAAIDEARNRINAIALVHKGLYEGDNITGVNMGRFLKQLTEDMRRALVLNPAKVDISVDVNVAPQNADTAIPIALFMIEALTNAVKHGYGKAGEINISLLNEGHNICLTVKDSGDAPHSNATPELAGMGHKLMSGFARQLTGDFHAERSSTGYIAQLVFPAERAPVI